MQTGWLRILSILFAALALVFSGAHLLELPHKIGLSASDYLTVQQLYRGWQFAGIVVVGTIVSIAWLAYAVRHERPFLSRRSLRNLGALIALLEALLGPARERTSSNTELARAMQPRRRLELQEVER